MGPLSEWVYRVCQVLYGLVLLLGTIWNLKRLYDNDRAGRSFQSGRSRTAIVMAVCAILLFPFLVPGAVYRFLALALFLGLHLLLLVWLDHHNQATRTGDAFRARDRAIKGMKRPMILAAILLALWILIWFRYGKDAGQAAGLVLLVVLWVGVWLARKDWDG